MFNIHLKNPNSYLMLLADVAMVSLALVGAYALRFDFFSDPVFLEGRYDTQLIRALAVVVPYKMVIFGLFGLYRGMWRYTNLRDMRKLAVAVMLSSMLMVSYIAYRYHFVGFARSVYVLDALLTFVLVAAVRISIRIGFGYRQFGSVGAMLKQSLPRQQRTLVIGAGYSGERLFRELQSDIRNPYQIIAYLDDDPKKHGRSLHGCRIFGAVDKLGQAIRKYEAELILIAISNVDGGRLRSIIEACEASGLPFKKVPNAQSIIDGTVSMKELRDVDFSDLLGRPAVKLDTSAIANYLEDRTVLITGAGGSIGSELVRQVIRFNPARLVLVDSCEENLFNIQMELQGVHGFEGIVPVIARVQDEPVMKKMFECFRPSTVYHAAAYKHVPLMENNPWQAIDNNVIGSYTVMKCAHEAGVKRFVLVSTDKAVRPTNIMGASKRMTELVLHAIAKQSSTAFMAVRFGNVLGSSGSVIPIFRKQIARGGPVTVTHPEMTRYFMTIPEAAQLILQAGALGQGGEIFILKMGTPVKIANMARDLIRLSGKEPDTEIEVRFTGIREGEKLYEELITEGEGIVQTNHEKIMVLRTEDESVYAEFQGALEERINELRSAAATHDACAIKSVVERIVPEYARQDCGSVMM
ncbi:UDP-N-acetyl-alpha-D-glucosamine C6 dehydratase [Pontiella desulfatans]|uniref:UDP-N-acetyl-alpha-D-glucosamine C6 dehydratase n=1 Tax=Pontiella desulfatans TaxID=2750659 RepID=A0A6C2U6G4_PONDE|nr:nucleoside-diphosphate sugar epimerase/dehydratase [Pontiella desulfatans]VGO15610.1 UDP-N-acetyl-alpha-D-glucosamine C6 dehydratase [Pontiella desulfatans]